MPLRKLITRNRSHVCVALWSICIRFFYRTANLDNVGHIVETIWFLQESHRNLRRHDQSNHVHTHARAAAHTHARTITYIRIYEHVPLN